VTAFPFIATTPLQPPTQIRDMQDVWDHFACQALDPTNPKKDNPEGWRLQYLTRLQSHCGGAPLATIFTGVDLLAEFDANFPKVKKGVHPRPDLDQDIEAYKTWRRQCRKTIEIATGVAADKAALRARQDGWTDLMAAIKLHCQNGGIIRNPRRAIPVTKLSDIARRAGVEPWHLADAGVLDRLEAAFAAPGDLQIVRRAQRFLRDFACIPEIGAVLPTQPVPIYPTRREHAALPAHIDAYLAQLVERASMTRDEVSGDDSDGVTDKTRARWLAALRHHVRTLPDCPAEPALGYTHPIIDLETVNDMTGLFARGHLYAALRRTKEVEHLPGHISLASAYDYYTDILRVLWDNNPELDDFGEQIDPDAPWVINNQTHRGLKNCKIMRDARELAQGMTKKNTDWCKALVRDKTQRNRFRRMHLTMMEAANEIIDAAEAEGRALTKNEIIQVRQTGACAAACAIEFSGRPIRMANVLGLRLHGARRNFFTPGKGRTTYSFVLHADETKSGKDEPETPLEARMSGPKVLDWYLKVIRPLFPHHNKSIYLFPAIQDVGQRLGHKTFDGWFQRGASAAKLPMTFHQWRHGYASLLLKADWNNLHLAAQMLGNTPAVCARNYGWLDTEQMILESQAKTLAAMEADQ
tara:strand:- start:7166 stop:9082 length:1917 start_codon:yes stop_codon:yes gene_type:complete